MYNASPCGNPDIAKVVGWFAPEDTVRHLIGAGSVHDGGLRQREQRPGSVILGIE